MYPECRHVLASGRTCNSPALAKSAWCYFHTGLHHRQSQRPAAHHSLRRPDGRFAALPAPEGSSVQTIDYGSIPVGAVHSATWENTPLDLPPVEDIESIQLALIDVLQALAANQLDAKRAGLLLYGLQVASANVQKMYIPRDGVRSVTYTEEGTPLAPQDYGYDTEDYEDEEEDDEE